MLEAGRRGGVSRWAHAGCDGTDHREREDTGTAHGGRAVDELRIHHPPGAEPVAELPVGRCGRGISTVEPGPLAPAGVYGVSGRQEGCVGQVRVWLRQHLLVLMASTSYDRGQAEGDSR